MAKELQELINEYRVHTDAANTAKALILEEFERTGVKSATASLKSAGGATLTTCASYRKASADTLVFDKTAFCADETRAALYNAFCTKPRKGSAATVAFKFETA